MTEFSKRFIFCQKASGAKIDSYLTCPPVTPCSPVSPGGPGSPCRMELSQCYSKTKWSVPLKWRRKKNSELIKSLIRFLDDDIDHQIFLHIEMKLKIIVNFNSGFSPWLLSILLDQEFLVLLLGHLSQGFLWAPVHPSYLYSRFHLGNLACHWAL